MRLMSDTPTSCLQLQVLERNKEVPEKLKPRARTLPVDRHWVCAITHTKMGNASDLLGCRQGGGLGAAGSISPGGLSAARSISPSARVGSGRLPRPRWWPLAPDCCQARMRSNERGVEPIRMAEPCLIARISSSLSLRLFNRPPNWTEPAEYGGSESRL
jgi:hypothetical protein